MRTEPMNAAAAPGTTPGEGRSALIINADDWGRDRKTTERTLDCVRRGTVSSVSAMVFMEDSERGAVIAQEEGIDAGLHLNLTTPFSVPGCSSRLMDYQRDIARYFKRFHPLARVVYHPGLVRAFDYVVAAQRDEYCRLYGTEPARIDGHHHAHLCSNVLLAGLLPAGTIIRRNYSFQAEEKVWYNRFYRKTVDWGLARRHRLTDFFFSIDPIDPGRLEPIFSLASRYTVEVATHPANDGDYSFLGGETISRLAAGTAIARRYAVS